jgi:hypothetical protein
MGQVGHDREPQREIRNRGIENELSRCHSL